MGPGDARPTALNILEDEDLVGKLAGKVIFITGCSSGLGIETARALSTTGATLYLTARDVDKAKEVLPDLKTLERVHFLKLDLESLDSVRDCAEEFCSNSKILNIFIANAGVMDCPEGRTQDGFEKQFGTNHLAHFLLFNLLKPTLLASSTKDLNSRAIFLTSAAHRNAEVNFSNLNLDGVYDSAIAYGQSKTANIWTANEIDRRYGTVGLHALAVHPGIIATAISRHLSSETMSEMAGDKQLRRLLKNVEQGAATTVWAATAKALEGTGGKFLNDCQIAKPWKEEDGPHGPGSCEWTYDPQKEMKLWKKSLDLVGLKDDLKPQSGETGTSRIHL